MNLLYIGEFLLAQSSLRLEAPQAYLIKNSLPAYFSCIASAIPISGPKVAWLLPWPNMTLTKLLSLDLFCE